MGQSKRTELAAAVALIVAGAASPPAAAQSPLQVYSSDWGGPNSAAPSGATRDTVIAVGVPRLRAVHRRLLAVQSALSNHGIPAHDHPHSHGVCQGDGDGDGDGGDGDGDGGGPNPGTPSATPGPGEMGQNPGGFYGGPSNGGDGAGGGGSR